MLRFSIILFATITLCGCSTTSISPNEADIVIPTIYQTESTANACKVTVIRDTGILGAGSAAFIYVNETLGAKLWAGDKVTFFLPPGQHFIKMKTGMVKDMVVLNLTAPGETKIRISSTLMNQATMTITN